MYKRSNLHLALLVFVLIILAVIMIAWFFMPLQEWVLALQSDIQAMGALGFVIFGLAYVLLVILLAPAQILTIAAGLLFGVAGFPLVVVSATIGAVLAFLVSRHVARQRVVQLMQKRPVLRAIDKAIQEESWKAVALLRLNPLVPFNLQNYLFGVTEIGLWPYALATFFCIMPGSAMYVYLGIMGGLAAGESEISGFKIALLVVGFVAVVILIWLVGRKAKARLKSLGVEESASSDASTGRATNGRSRSESA